MVAIAHCPRFGMNRGDMGFESAMSLPTRRATLVNNVLSDNVRINRALKSIGYRVLAPTNETPQWQLSTSKRSRVRTHNVLRHTEPTRNDHDDGYRPIPSKLPIAPRTTIRQSIQPPSLPIFGTLTSQKLRRPSKNHPPMS